MMIESGGGWLTLNNAHTRHESRSRVFERERKLTIPRGGVVNGAAGVECYE